MPLPTSAVGGGVYDWPVFTSPSLANVRLAVDTF
jgi:hypothetical protein